MGEFGRTPKINPNAGRDHFPRVFNVALAGGGVKGGQVIGASNPDGTEVKDRPVERPRPAGLDLPFAQGRPDQGGHDAGRPADQGRRRRQAGPGAVRLARFALGWMQGIGRSRSLLGTEGPAAPPAFEDARP